MNLAKLLLALKSPQGAVSLLSLLIAGLGTAGIVAPALAAALGGLLTAILGVITAVRHNAVVALLTGSTPDAPVTPPVAPVAPPVTPPAA